MKRVFVIGSINLDVFVTTERLPRFGETVSGFSIKFLPGGKGANQAVAAARAGATVHLIGAIGSDTSTHTLRDFLEAESVNIDGVITVPGPSGAALVTVDATGENAITVVAGANDSVSTELVGRAPIKPSDIVVLQNEIPRPVIHHALERAHSRGAVTIYNPAPYKPIPPEFLPLIDYLILNETEFADFSGTPANLMTPALYEEELNHGLGQPTNIIVTLGKHGLVARVNGSTAQVLGHTVKSVDTTGAGDCFTGAFAAALAENQTATAALFFANAAAALSVQVLGAGPAMPYRTEVEKFLSKSK